MPKPRIILSIDQETLDILTDEAENLGISRNLLIVQIIRKHINRPSILNKSGLLGQNLEEDKSE